MRTYHIQYRQQGNVHITPVKASSLEEGKEMVKAQEGLKEGQMLKDEAMV